MISKANQGWHIKPVGAAKRDNFKLEWLDSSNTDGTSYKHITGL